MWFQHSKLTGAKKEKQQDRKNHLCKSFSSPVRDKDAQEEDQPKRKKRSTHKIDHVKREKATTTTCRSIQNTDHVDREKATTTRNCVIKGWAWRSMDKIDQGAKPPRLRRRRPQEEIGTRFILHVIDKTQGTTNETNYLSARWWFNKRILLRVVSSSLQHGRMHSSSKLVHHSL